MKLISMILMLLMIATQQLDKPYSYASAGPSSYDCSGLVVYCYRQVFSVELPRTAKEIGYNTAYPTIVGITNLKKGDIVCFNTNRGDSDLSDHVGLYLGDGEFIHSSSGKGRVIISRLDEGYYNERFSWGKRIVDY